MKDEFPGIADGGEERLRDAIEAQVRRAHNDELTRATDIWQKAAIETTIKKEIEQEMKRVCSPYSLWSSS